MATWLITGCSTGIGRSLARAVLAGGGNAVVTARNVDSIRDVVEPYADTARAVALDVSRPEQVQEAVDVALETFGGVDVLANNAGHGYRAAVEEGDDPAVRELFETNFFGPVRLIKAVLPGMRSRRSGTIINVSSIAGRRTAAGSGYYSATKFAIEGMSDGLRKELEPLGIRVIVLDLGAFRTDFSGRSMQQPGTRIDDYEATIGPRRPENDTMNGRQPGDPDRAASVLVEIAEGPKAPFRLVLGSDAVQVIRDELDAQVAELAAWEELSRTTDFAAHGA